MVNFHPNQIIASKARCSIRCSTRVDSRVPFQILESGRSIDNDKRTSLRHRSCNFRRKKLYSAGQAELLSIMKNWFLMSLSLHSIKLACLLSYSVSVKSNYSASLDFWGLKLWHGIQHNNTQHNDTQNSDILPNDTQHNTLSITILSNTHDSILALCWV